MADVIREQWRLPKFRRVGRSLVTEGTRYRAPFILVKPQTYMNLSGSAVTSLLTSTSLDPSHELLLLVDDLALPLGTFRLRARGSAGGHNGLKSVEIALGSDEYARLRIGIGPMPDDAPDQADWVLSPFARTELDQLADLLPSLVDAVECWMSEGIAVAMNRYNRRGTTE